MTDSEFCVDDLRHYEVVSPEMSRIDVVCDDGTGPCEYGCDWCVVLAPNKREARIKAIKHDDFSDWVDEARGDGINPFTGLVVTLARCEHGVCWICRVETAPDGITCDECRKDANLEFLSDVAGLEEQ
jgi:hypothetical protein